VRVAVTDVLWAGIVQALSLDLTARTAQLDVRVTHSGTTTDWRLALAGVTELRVERPDVNDWTYTELTEAHVHAGGDGRKRVELVFWDEPNGLWATCSEVSVSRL
jgi:hypothetical protein